MPVDKNISILVVDDYPTMIKIIKNLLAQLGFSNVDDANEGGEALKKMGQKTYELIISDLNMLNMGGLDFFKQIRGNGNMVPFIMITGENKESNLQASRKAGIKHFIVKPFDETALKTALENIFGKI